MVIEAWRHTFGLLIRSFRELLEFVGVTSIGFWLLYIALPVLAFIISVSIKLFSANNRTAATLWTGARKSIRSAIMTLLITSAMLCLFNAWFAVKVLYKEHQHLALDLERINNYALCQNRELFFLRQRVIETVRYLPQPKLTKDQEKFIQKNVGKLDKQKLIISYLDTPTSGASPFAFLIADLFFNAGWHVEIHQVNEGYEYDRGFRMIAESPSSLNSTPLKLQEILLQVGIPCELKSRSDIKDHIEFLITNMP